MVPIWRIRGWQPADLALVKRSYDSGAVCQNPGLGADESTLYGGRNVAVYMEEVA